MLLFENVSTKAMHRGHAWSWDFVHNTTMKGGSLRMLNIIDEYKQRADEI